MYENRKGLKESLIKKDEIKWLSVCSQKRIEKTLWKKRINWNTEF
jgi:hypothetical protein